MIDEATSPMVSGSNLRTQRILFCLVCGVPTLHRPCIRKNGCNVLACSACGVGRADTINFDPAAYYTDAYFEGRQADGSADYAASEAVLRREFKVFVLYPASIRRTRLVARFRSAGAPSTSRQWQSDGRPQWVRFAVRPSTSILGRTRSYR